MLIAKTTAQLNDLIALTAIMKQMLAEDSVDDFVALLEQCGYPEDGDEIIEVSEVKLAVVTENSPVLVISYKFTDDTDEEDTGRFYVRSKDGVVTGEY